MKICNNCKTSEDCLNQKECEIKALEMLDDFIQNNEFDFDIEPDIAKYECN